MNKEFDKWWNGSEVRHPTNPYKADTPEYWAYEAWMWGAAAEREACAAICDRLAEGEPISDNAAIAAEVIRARGGK